ncbi:RNA polymerase subunit sigma [Anaerobacillus alkalidiazotrophicus]|uniref:RNA polymerase sigma factor n=1 Tax=Anaerobacillus alkalidiazotrophicus TaxID=472963 RepID=A0A1S2M3C6_9BACI|nr:sigma-70 family RNA polymerase sigma factor [Anaerobacillus alkalidiazotrophicus]OIJ19211.1 RNA polymerase subunit sigma [Anaerobacillus alkalidiazotrophicus]
MEEANDINQLIELVLSKNQQAFGELYERTIHDVYRTVHFLLDEKTNVDDIVQETYIQVYKNLKKFDKTKPFKPWITGIAIKQIHSYRRKSWMGLRILKKFERTEPRNVIDQTDDLIDKISNKEIYELVNLIPYKLKQVIILHYLNEYSQEEVSEILNIPLGTVKSRINAALTKLRQKGHSNQNLFEEVRNAQ